jgi:hypothetical protein
MPEFGYCVAGTHTVASPRLGCASALLQIKFFDPNCAAERSGGSFTFQIPFALLPANTLAISPARV